MLNANAPVDAQDSLAVGQLEFAASAMSVDASMNGPDVLHVYLVGLPIGRGDARPKALICMRLVIGSRVAWNNLPKAAFLQT